MPAALERLAIIGHNARLASFEGDFRALSDSYDKYLKRAAALQIRELMGQTTRLYPVSYTHLDVYKRQDLFHQPGFNHQVETETGILGDACSEMMTEFFRSLRQKKM